MGRDIVLPLFCFKSCCYYSMIYIKIQHTSKSWLYFALSQLWSRGWTLIFNKPEQWKQKFTSKKSLTRYARYPNLLYIIVYILNNGCGIQCKAWSCDFLLIRCISTISRKVHSDLEKKLWLQFFSFSLFHPKTSKGCFIFSCH